MRHPNLPVLTAIAASILLSMSAGCQNSSLLCRRETALLRAEILDLEDKYYALQAQNQSLQSGQPGTAGTIMGSGIGSGVIVGSHPVVIDGMPMAGSVVQGDIIYDGSVINDGEIIYDSSIPTDGEVIYDNGIMTLPMAPEVYYPETETVPGALPVAPGSGSESQGSSTRAPINESPGDAAFDLELPALQTDYEKTTSGKTPTTLNIDTARTRGVNLDASEGDDGLVLMIHSRDENGNFALPKNDLAVIVTEPSGKEVGKWTFVPDELSLFVSRDELDNTEGILLHLPWLDNVPRGASVIVNAKTLDRNSPISDTASVNIKSKSYGSSDANSANTFGSPMPDLQSSGWNGSTPTVRPVRSRSTSIERPTWKPVR